MIIIKRALIRALFIFGNCSDIKLAAVKTGSKKNPHYTNED